ncbi:hypothetical protein CBL_11368 [Carabus blaptoides fortunei]
MFALVKLVQIEVRIMMRNTRRANVYELRTYKQSWHQAEHSSRFGENQQLTSIDGNGYVMCEELRLAKCNKENTAEVGNVCMLQYEDSLRTCAMNIAPSNHGKVPIVPMQLVYRGVLRSVLNLNSGGIPFPRSGLDKAGTSRNSNRSSRKRIVTEKKWEALKKKSQIILHMTFERIDTTISRMYGLFRTHTTYIEEAKHLSVVLLDQRSAMFGGQVDKGQLVQCDVVSGRHYGILCDRCAGYSGILNQGLGECTRPVHDMHRELFVSIWQETIRQRQHADAEVMCSTRTEVDKLDGLWAGKNKTRT